MADQPNPPELLVVGLGNPILTDDAVGLRVAQEVADKASPERVRTAESTRGGLDLVDLISGAHSAHLIDAILSDEHQPGEILRLGVDQLPRGLTLASSHEVDLTTALELAEKLGYPIPKQLVIWAIVVRDPYTVSEEMTPEVAEAVGACAGRILAELGELPGGANGA